MTSSRLLAGIDAAKLGYQCTEHVATENAMHVVLTKRSNNHCRSRTRHGRVREPYPQ
ncbi:MAG TPA: hypothetical protein VE251_02030 [Xanthobacteraceae bacterium]|nr:hypothetical protein [Xanthobacteraceae bacterium]